MGMNYLRLSTVLTVTSGKKEDLSKNEKDWFAITKKRLTIIGAVLGMFIVCAFFVMFIAEQYNVRSALCVTCHNTKPALKTWGKDKH